MIPVKVPESVKGGPAHNDLKALLPDNYFYVK